MGIIKFLGYISRVLVTPIVFSKSAGPQGEEDKSKFLRRLLTVPFDWLASVPGLEIVYQGNNNCDKNLALVHAVYDRFESLHQALCLASFGAMVGCFLNWFEILSKSLGMQNATKTSQQSVWLVGVHVVGSIVFATLALVLYYTVRLAITQRIKHCQNVLNP